MSITKSDLLKFILTYRYCHSFVELVYRKTFRDSEYITCAVYKHFGFPDSDFLAFCNVLNDEEVYYLPLLLRPSEANEDIVVKGQKIVDVRLFDSGEYQSILANYQNRETFK